LIERKLVIWNSDKDKVMAESKDLQKEGVRTGVEPININDLPRELRSQRLKMTVADDQKLQPAPGRL
jgi:hypothetical protein